MRYKIFENGEQINTIIASAEFVQSYCEANGYTYELEELPQPEPEPEPTGESITDADMAAAIIEGVNSI